MFLFRSYDKDGSPAHYTSSTILGGPRFQEGTRPAKDKLERHGQERLARNGTYLGRGGGGSSQQTRMASECGPRSRGRGMNQVKSSQDVYYFYLLVCFFHYLLSFIVWRWIKLYYIDSNWANRYTARGRFGRKWVPHAGLIGTQERGDYGWLSNSPMSR